MPDRLDGQLEEAGQLLREWRDEQMTLGRSQADDGALPLPPALPAPDRRWMLGAAAALVLLAGAVTVVAWNRGDDSVPVATASTTVALVPGSTDGWDEVVVQGPVGSEPSEPTAIIARRGTLPADGQFVHLTTFQVASSDIDVPPAERVELGGHDGWLYDDGDGVRSLHILPADGNRTALQVVAGPEVSTTELAELATGFDPGTPLGSQPIAEGWELVVDGSLLTGAYFHWVNLRQHGDEPVPPWATNATIATSTGVSPQVALWFLVKPSTETVTIRGVEGWLSHDTHSDGSAATLSWIEDDHAVVTVSVANSDDTVDVVAMALELAEDLVPVDAAGWDQFARQASGQAAGSGSSSGEEIATDTTLLPPDNTSATAASPDTPPEPLLPEFSDIPEGSNGLAFALPGGKVVQVYAVESTGQLCWGLADDENPRCDPAGSMAIDGEQAIQPRLARSDDDSIQFLYGFLPPEAATASITATGERSSSGAAVMIGGRVWAAPFALANGATDFDVEYLDTDGTVVAEGSYP